MEILHSIIAISHSAIPNLQFFKEISYCKSLHIPQQAFTYSKLTIEALEQGVKLYIVQPEA